ncbi:hypothetical protein QA584_24690 [Anaerocolumna sp. AGMB13025]|uniref:hypothetical protein n=1 Tax=Anaerocolumna sp. AGMB13025 TaxID=3039116 RepID=UPI0024203F05|nr:hypothetical protein [Anaerocolumna sp. AGMB13025]WFR56774.1 hypothetical protein QA584_24690 [Anaerocolumna sp. AGMB13025]
MSTKDAHFKLLPLLSEMPQRGIMFGSVKKFIIRKVTTQRIFHTFLFVAVSQGGLGYAMGVNYERGILSKTKNGT